MSDVSIASNACIIKYVKDSHLSNSVSEMASAMADQPNQKFLNSFNLWEWFASWAGNALNQFLFFQLITACNCPWQQTDRWRTCPSSHVHIVMRSHDTLTLSSKHWYTFNFLMIESYKQTIALGKSSNNCTWQVIHSEVQLFARLSWAGRHSPVAWSQLQAVHMYTGKTERLPKKRSWTSCSVIQLCIRINEPAP